MKALIYNFRVWLANVLVRLAHWVRPKTMNEFMKSMEDALIFGNGITRISPKDFFIE
jgi:hypothetical protein